MVWRNRWWQCALVAGGACWLPMTINVNDVVAASSMASTAMPTLASSLAYGCGNSCEVCNPEGNWRVGGNTIGQGPWWNGSCQPNECWDCRMPELASAEPASELGQRLKATAGAELGQLITENAERLLWHPERRLVVVLGGCDGQSFETLVFLNALQSEERALNGLAFLETVMAESAAKASVRSAE